MGYLRISLRYSLILVEMIVFAMAAAFDQAANTMEKPHGRRKQTQ